jgi:hypothetical protein
MGDGGGAAKPGPYPPAEANILAEPPAPAVRGRRPGPVRFRRRWVVGAAVALTVLVIAAVASSKTAKTNVSSSAPTTSEVIPTSASPSTSSSEATATSAPGASASSASATPSTEFDNPNAAGAPTIGGPVVGATASPGPSACRSGNPLANVYHPDRLGVVDGCATVSGTVMSITPEEDGDIHFDLALDPPYARLLTAANLTYQHGWLVAEIVPADQPGCIPGQPPKAANASYDFGICSGTDEQTPAIGTHVFVTGPHVVDYDHGNWAEIHPVWAVSSHAALPQGGTNPSTATSAPPAPSSAGTTITATPSGVTPGDYASLTAQTSPGATCSLAVTLPSGARSASAGLGPATADITGRVTWTWKISTRTTPGTATATVSCATGSSVSAPFQVI